MGSFSRKSSETLHLPTLKCDTSQGLGLTFQLGSDYENKKHKLLQELQLDYKHYVTKDSHQKKNLKPHAPNVHHKGLSLPINERASIKERLREERNKEYNLFLQEQAQKRRFKRETPPVISKQERFQASDVSIASRGSHLPFHNPQTPLPHKELPASRRDAATLTESGDTGGRAWSLGPPRRRRWQIHKPRELSSSEEELCTDEEQGFHFSRQRRQDKEPRYKEERRTQKHRVDRDFQDPNEMEAPVPSDQNNKDLVLESDSKHIPDSMRTAARSTPVTCKDKAEPATGLMIGAAEDQTILQMKKEQYKQELLRQIAEQQRNKIKEKKLVLKVGATGAADPEKEPDRIKQFRTARQEAPHRSGADAKDANPTDESTHYRTPRGNPQVDFNMMLSQLPVRTVLGPEQDVPLFDYTSEDYYGNSRRMPGEVYLPKVASVAPPFPPIVPNMYKTPYDAALAFYRARNQFEIQDNLQGGAQQFRTFETLPPIRANEGSPFATEGLPADTSKQRRESVLRYQEALKQQIQEREGQKRSAKEEKERRDAKSEAEMRTYDPWGRSGAGAPIKDQHGNLISDLKQMHIINENRMLSPRGAGSPVPQQLSGSSHHNQNRYKEELKQQMEENRRRRAEEQENLRSAAEKDEKRLEEERARILQQYEEEQRIQKLAQNNHQNLKHVHQVQMQHTEMVKSTKKPNKIVPQSAKEREEKTSQITYQTAQRQPSPPIPTLQRKLKNTAASKPNSVERSLSAPHVQPVPRNIPTPRESEGQPEVMKRLSALRNLLKTEQREVEQLGLVETNHSHLGRRRLRIDAFEAANKESFHPLSRSPASANAEKQNKQIQNGDVLDYQPSHYYSRRKPAVFIPRNASLPFEMAFTGEEQINLQGGPQPSEERWDMTASQGKQVVEDFVDEKKQNDLPGNQRTTNQNKRQDFKCGDHSSGTGSALSRPVSVGTVETDLRLRHSEHQKV